MIVAIVLIVAVTVMVAAHLTLRWINRTDPQVHVATHMHNGEVYVKTYKPKS